MDSKTIELLIKKIKECGELMLSAYDIEKSILIKSCAADFVTEYDGKVQEILYNEVKKLMPEAHFVGEEDRSDTVNSGYAFIVDPIDGTTNFSKGYKCSVISVGLLFDGSPYMGIVYNPYLDELFYAKKGEGAYVNGKRIYVSTHSLKDGVGLFGTSPYYDDKRKRTFVIAEKVCGYAMDIRRSGSAAWDLCCVAAGRAEGFFELILSPWDYAAGACILAEAGGIITKRDKTPLEFDKKCSVLGAAPSAYDELYSIVNS